MSDHHSGEFSKMGGKCPETHFGKFSKMGGKCPSNLLTIFSKEEENVLTTF
jgi:hypothetical protein